MIGPLPLGNLEWTSLTYAVTVCPMKLGGKDLALPCMQTERTIVKPPGFSIHLGPSRVLHRR